MCSFLKKMPRLWFTFCSNLNAVSEIGKFGVDIASGADVLDVLIAIISQYNQRLSKQDCSTIFLCNNNGSRFENDEIVTLQMLDASREFPFILKYTPQQRLDIAKLSRLQLLDRTEYLDDLDKLLNLVMLAELPEPKSSIIEKYRLGRRVRDSEAYALTVENLSTVASKGCFDMSNFDISSLHGEHKVTVKVVRLNNEKLHAFLADQLFSGSIDELHRSLAELTPVINNLRSHFIFLREKEFGYTEPGYFQPLYTLFLERFAATIGRSTSNKTGSAFPLSVDADVMLDSGHIDSVTITGKTDIVKVPFMEDSNYDDIDFLMELKPPFGALYHATSDSPKGQLVCQLLGLWEMSSDMRKMTIGGLSDIFALVIFFAYADSMREFSMTKSVANAQEYLLHLMLLFCSDCDVRELVESEGESKPLFHGDDKEQSLPRSSDHEPDPGPDNGERKLHSMSRRATGAVSALSRRTATSGTSAAKKVLCADDYDAPGDGESELQQWYARHNGFPSLSKDNIGNNRLYSHFL